MCAFRPPACLSQERADLEARRKEADLQRLQQDREAGSGRPAGRRVVLDGRPGAALAQVDEGSGEEGAA